MIQTEHLETPKHRCTEHPNPNPKSWRTRFLAAALLCLCAAAAPSVAASALTGLVNVNIASPEELELLPGIGATRAVAIIAERDHRGGFKSVDELVEVKGIGEGMLVRLRPYVSLSGKSTAEAVESASPQN